jgi:hypothetical protein
LGGFINCALLEEQQDVIGYIFIRRKAKVCSSLHKNYTFLCAESEASQFYPSKMSVTVQIILTPGENQVKLYILRISLDYV